MVTITPICGLVATCVSQTTYCLHPCLRNTVNNWKDVCIFAIQEVGTVAIICITILLVVRCIIKKLYKWNAFKRQDEINDANLKRNHEIEDREVRQKAISNDLKLKRIEALQDKMIAYMENRIKEGKKIEKDDPFIAKFTEMINNYTTTENKDNQEPTASNCVPK